MHRSIVLWIIAFVVSIASAVYQRVTGPTYPVKGTTTLDGQTIPFTFKRSHGDRESTTVELTTTSASIHGSLEWRRYGSDNPWRRVPLVFVDGRLTADVPSQPPAGKVEYRVYLSSPSGTVIVPSQDPVVLRFKGDVPSAILLFHIIGMFGGMVVSTRGGLEYLAAAPRLRGYIYCTIALFLVGGLIFGPLVQKYAFGSYWTGWPVGHDLTDNKTALAFLLWVVAAIMLRRSRRPALWVLAAAFVTFIVFMIPHSLLGSELKYSATGVPLN